MIWALEAIEKVVSMSELVLLQAQVSACYSIISQCYKELPLLSKYLKNNWSVRDKYLATKTQMIAATNRSKRLPLA